MGPKHLLTILTRGIGLLSEPSRAIAQHQKNPFLSLFRDRRGVTAVAFGVTATIVVGFVALGTEGGTWYLTRREAQNAADPAAYAGAVRLSLAQYSLGLTLASGQAQAIAASADDATRNGFTNGQANTAVTVNTPPTSGSNAGNTTAVEVIITRTPARLISRLFLAADPVIRTRAVAALEVNGKVCVLALKAGLTLQGNSTTATNCSLASNATSSSAINVNGNPTVNVTSLISSGGCSGCSGLPAQTYQPPAKDPYTALNSTTYSKPTTCLATPPSTGTGTYSIAVPTATQGFCSNLGLNTNGYTWDFAPGTYLFWNSSLKVTGGNITCTGCTNGAGVTFIFAGSNASQVGTVSVNTTGTVTLTAPGSGAYAGILIYRDYIGSSSGNPEVQITGSASMTLTGAIYAPSSYVSFSGNSGTNCLILDASRVNISGTSTFSGQACPNTYGVPLSQIVKLVE
jgi:Flp pilus assembly protein TadG